MRLIGLVVLTGLGMLLAVAGTAKARDRYQFAAAVREWAVFGPSAVPIVATVILSAEIAVGLVAVVAGSGLAPAARVPASILVLLVLVVLLCGQLAVLMSRGRRRCGCFGGSSMIGVFSVSRGLALCVLSAVPILVSCWDGAEGNRDLSGTATPPGMPSLPPNVQAIISAVESGDAGVIQGLFQPFSVPCNDPTEPGGGSAPCPGGVATGTRMDVVFRASCQGSFVAATPDTLRDLSKAIVSYSPRLFAVAKMDDPGADRRGPGKYLLIFDFLFGPDHWGRSLKVDSGITEFFFGCGLSPREVAQRQTDFLVPPPP